MESRWGAPLQSISALQGSATLRRAKERSTSTANGGLSGHFLFVSLGKPALDGWTERDATTLTSLFSMRYKQK